MLDFSVSDYQSASGVCPRFQAVTERNRRMEIIVLLRVIMPILSAQRRRSDGVNLALTFSGHYRVTCTAIN